MAILDKVKKLVDIPMWETMRWFPSTFNYYSAWAQEQSTKNRYIYMTYSSSYLWRYDTWTDGYMMVNPPLAGSSVGTALTHCNKVGPVGTILTATSNTAQVGGVSGKQLIGFKIRIMSGTGAGQERTITDVKDPVVWDTLRATSAGANSFTDSAKAYAINQWRNYTIRMVMTTGMQLYRRILYNDATNIYWNDTNLLAIEPFAAPSSYISPSASSITVAQIESTPITVDTPWTIIPDTSSRFMIMSGGLFNATASTTYFGFYYYDIIQDTWYFKNYPTSGSIMSAAAGTDLAISAISDGVGSYVTGTATSTTGYSITDTTQNMQEDRWVGYRVRINSGTGAGQDRIIILNDKTTVTVAQKWDVTPDNTSTFDIVNDTDKVYMVGNAQAGMFQYSIKSDMWSSSRIFDHGSCCNMSVRWNGHGDAQAISTITRTFATNTVTATVTTVLNHCLKVGDSVSIAGVTPVAYNGTYTITTVPSLTTFTYTFTAGADPGAASAISSQSTSQLVDTAANWDLNALVGKICIMTTAAGYGPAYQLRRITANTATTLTFAAGTAPTNGTCKYIITDANGLGAQESRYSMAAQYEGYGFASVTRTFANGYATVTVTTTGSNTFATGDIVTITGITPSGYNGNYSITVTSPTTFTYSFPAATDPGAPIAILNAYATTPQINPAHFFSLSSITATGSGPYTVTVTTNKAHPFAVGDQVSIWGVTPTTFNGYYSIVSVPSTTTFTFSSSNNPGTTGAAGVISGGSTTTFTDSGKNFVASNVVGKRIRFIAGACAGQESIVTSATATALNFNAITGTPDDTSVYTLLGATGTSSNPSLVWLASPSEPAKQGKYLYVFEAGGTARLRRYNICTDKWEPVAYAPYIAETFSTGTMYAYDGQDRIYILSNNSNRVLAYDVVNDNMIQYGMPPNSMSTGYCSNRMAVVTSPDGAKYLYVSRSGDNWLWRTIILT